MFQDDRMIPVLSTIVLMVVIGTVLQRVEGIDRFLGGTAAPIIELRDDEVAAPASALLRIDVFANDAGVTDEMRQRLSVITAPACGRLFVRDGVLEYLADAGCEGHQTIRYSFGGATAEQVATVTARIRASADPRSPGPIRPDAPEPVVASNGSAPAPAADGAAAHEPASSQAPATPVPDVPASASASSTGAAATAIAVAAASAAQPAATVRAPQKAALPALASAAASAGEIPAMLLPAVAPGVPGAPPALVVATPAPGLVTSAETPAAPTPVMTTHAGAPAVLAGAGEIGPGLSAPMREPVGETDTPAATSGRAAELVTAGFGAAAAYSSGAEESVALAGAERLAIAEAVSGQRPPSDGAGTAPLSAAAPAPTLAPAPLLSAAAEPAVAEKLAALAGTVSAVSQRTTTAMPETVKAAPGNRASARRAPGGATRSLAALPDDVAEERLPVNAAPTLVDEPPRVAMTIAALNLLPDTEPGPGTVSFAEPGIAAPLPAGAAPPGRSVRGAVPGGTPAVLAPWPEVPRPGLPGGADAEMTFAAATAADPGPRPVQDPEATGPAFLLAVIGHGGAGVADASVFPDAAPAAASTGLPAGTGAPEDGTRIAALAPALPTAAVPAPGPALDALPAERIVLPTPRPAWLAAGAEDGVRTAALDPTAALPGPGDAGVVATAAVPVSRAVPVEPCLAPPAMTLEVRHAAETIVGVTAPCHAATVAELSYSGLRLAVPLDGNGQGVVRVQGFEPNTPALLTFNDGTALDFELPFKGVDRVSRVALAWDAPVELELNALEYGAAPGTPGHVRPGLARSFEEVRRSGGGYLTVWHPVGGLGQSLQVYSWYHRSGESAGVVKLLLDFVSRDRDRLAATCGDGPAAAPQFIVLRSEGGRPERPVIRQLAPLECGRVAAQGRDNRLISGAVDDLVITSR